MTCIKQYSICVCAYKEMDDGKDEIRLATQLITDEVR